MSSTMGIQGGFLGNAMYMARGGLDSAYGQAFRSGLGGMAEDRLVALTQLRALQAAGVNILAHHGWGRSPGVSILQARKAHLCKALFGDAERYMRTAKNAERYGEYARSARFYLKALRYFEERMERAKSNAHYRLFKKIAAKAAIAGKMAERMAVFEAASVKMTTPGIYTYDGSKFPLIKRLFEHRGKIEVRDHGVLLEETQRVSYIPYRRTIIDQNRFKPRGELNKEIETGVNGPSDYLGKMVFTRSEWDLLWRKNAVSLQHYNSWTTYVGELKDCTRVQTKTFIDGTTLYFYEAEDLVHLVPLESIKLYESASKDPRYLEGVHDREAALISFFLDEIPKLAPHRELMWAEEVSPNQAMPIRAEVVLGGEMYVEPSQPEDRTHMAIGIMHSHPLSIEYIGRSVRPSGGDLWNIVTNRPCRGLENWPESIFYRDGKHFECIVSEEGVAIYTFDPQLKDEIPFRIYFSINPQGSGISDFTREEAIEQIACAARLWSRYDSISEHKLRDMMSSYVEEIPWDEVRSFIETGKRENV